MTHIRRGFLAPSLHLNMERSTLVTAISLSLLGLGAVQAATINVSGGCNLVDAIVSANTDTATGSCVAGNGSDTLVLQSSSLHSFSTYNNTADGYNAVPSITSNITIQGNNATIERDSVTTNKFRLFHIGVAGILTLDQVTISNGSVTGVTIPGAGGAILNRGNIILSNVSISGNNAHNGGGLYNMFGSTATLNNTTVQSNTVFNNGGGLFNSQNSIVTVNNSSVLENNSNFGSGGGLYNFVSTVTFNNSTISRNSAFSTGGGLHNRQSIVTLTGSTISDNNSQQGGGLHGFSNSIVTLSGSTVSGNSAQSSGGGFSNFLSTAVLSNSTLSGNSAAAGAGMASNSSIVSLTNSTVSDNVATTSGGGLYNTSGITGRLTTVTLANSIIGNSSGGDCVNTSDGTVFIDSASSNWFEDSTCNGVAQGNPDLGPLANNGGPTLTHTLLPGSGAIDAGDNSICSILPVNNLDQRGVERPQGEICDIGAVELRKTGFFVIPLPNNKTVVIPI